MSALRGGAFDEWGFADERGVRVPGASQGRCELPRLDVDDGGRPRLGPPGPEAGEEDLIDPEGLDLVHSGLLGEMHTGDDC